MLKETNIDAVKSVALMFLNLDVEIDERYPILCHHPFFENTFYPLHDNENLSVLDLRNKEDLKIMREKIKEEILRIDKFRRFLILVRKPYLPAFFKYTEQYLSVEDYSKCLADIWVSVEFPNTDKNISPKGFIKYFKKAKKELLMEEDELKRFNSFPDEIVIYRGVKSKGSVKALSWTTDKKVAQWFADRFEKNGEVYQAKIKKEDILAYFNSRDEKEVVVDFTKLYEIKKI